MAKDVRKFVQNFNMSRQLSDQKQSISNEEPAIADPPKSEEHKRKRNDWSEYIGEGGEESGAKFERNSPQGDNGIEPLIVTELPKTMFVKPKERDYSCKTNIRDGRGSQDSQERFLHSAKDKNSKWNSFMSRIRETRDLATGAAAKKTVSMWSSFITEEHDDNPNSEIWEKREGYPEMNEEERVEEDIHPDFL